VTPRDFHFLRLENIQNVHKQKRRLSLAFTAHLKHAILELFDLEVQVAMPQSLACSELCRKCSQFFCELELFSEEDDLLLKHFEFHEFQALLSSAGQGCHLCSCLAGAIDPSKIETLLQHDGQRSTQSSERTFFEYRVSRFGMMIHLKALQLFKKSAI
jgi:hypothetical protein